MAKCCRYVQMDQSSLGIQEDWSHFSNVPRAALTSSDTPSQSPPNCLPLSSKHFQVPAIDIPSAASLPGLSTYTWDSSSNLQRGDPAVLGGNPQALLQNTTEPEHATWDYNQLLALASAPFPVSSGSSTPATTPLSSLAPATPQVNAELGSSANPYRLPLLGSPTWNHAGDSSSSAVTQSEQQIASELAELVSRWSVEQQLRVALQGAGQTQLSNNTQGREVHIVSSATPPSKPVPCNPSLQNTNQGQDALAKIVACLSSREAPPLTSSASAKSLPELAQQCAAPQDARGALTRNTSLPALHSWRDPIGSAFAVLDHGLQNPEPSGTRIEPLDASLTSSMSSPPLSPCGMLEGGILFSYERPLNKTERLKMLTKQDLAHFFDVPISEACRQLGVGLTVLKKRCRELGVRRWPHRKLKSMKVLIETVQQLSQKDNGQAQRQIGSAIQRLEAERCNIEAVPTLTLTKETRKFRQACFKAKYKMRSLTSCAKT